MTSNEIWYGYMVYIWLDIGSRLHSKGVSGAVLELGSEVARWWLLHL
jgi:hypothetical protein